MMVPNATDRRELSDTRVGMFIDNGVDVSQSQYAATVVVSFESIKSLIGDLPAPKRPARNRPLQLPEVLETEMQAWNRLSAEASAQIWE